MRKVGFFSLCSVLTGLAGVACGGDRPATGPSEPAATDAGAREASREASSDPARTADARMVTEKRPAATTAPPSSETPPQTDSGAATPKGPGCVPESGTDEPDEDFADTNCDGIDGDANAAVFVAPTGADDAEGSLDAPVKTLTHAIELAAKAGKSVYACDGEYAENVVMADHAANLYGGYACDHGCRRERDLATVNPKGGVPLTVTETTMPLVVDRIAFRAPDATGMGESSIAASIVGAHGVTFRRVLLAAGNATAGEAGAPVPAPRWSPQEPAADAVPLTITTYCMATSEGWDGDTDCAHVSRGAIGENRKCPFTGPVRGGDGGDGGNYYLHLDETVGGMGLPSGDGSLDAISLPARAYPGTTATSGFGKIVDGLYVANNRGGDATHAGFRGYAGRGGKGGASPARSDPNPDVKYWPGGGGGQGGYGGCGGPPGKGGKGGGASIALITVDTEVRLDTSIVQTGRGGDGGDGSDGGPGQPGGPGGKGAVMSQPSFPGGDGGRGGDGSAGGSGGPGGGGPSIGIAWIGTSVMTKDVTFELGHSGRGGTSLDATGPQGEHAEIYPPLASDAGK